MSHSTPSKVKPSMGSASPRGFHKPGLKRRPGRATVQQSSSLIDYLYCAVALLRYIHHELVEGRAFRRLEGVRGIVLLQAEIRGEDGYFLLLMIVTSS
jgi:hypothetical protein